MKLPATSDFATAYATVRRRTLLSEAKCRAIWEALHSLGGVPGDLAELGVYRGGVCRLMAMTGRTVHAFDTFEGMPRSGYDPGLDGHKPGEFSDEQGVLAYLGERPNVAVHRGLFPASADGLADARFALVHLDADLYASTVAGLRWFWPRLNAGGAIVLDDWQWQYCRGVEKAVGEFMDGRTDAEMRESAPHQLTITKR